MKKVLLILNLLLVGTYIFSADREGVHNAVRQRYGLGTRVKNCCETSAYCVFLSCISYGMYKFATFNLETLPAVREMRDPDAQREACSLRFCEHDDVTDTDVCYSCGKGESEQSCRNRQKDYLGMDAFNHPPKYLPYNDCALRRNKKLKK